MWGPAGRSRGMEGVYTLKGLLQVSAQGLLPFPAQLLLSRATEGQVQCQKEQAAYESTKNITLL